jgi:hypothetical protein
MHPAEDEVVGLIDADLGGGLSPCDAQSLP